MLKVMNAYFKNTDDYLFTINYNNIDFPIITKEDFFMILNN